MNFKSDLNEIDYQSLKDRIVQYFAGKSLHTDKGVDVAFSWHALDRILGFAYCDDMFTICNCTLKFDELRRYVAFQINTDGKFIFTLWDKDEKETLIEF